MTCIARDGDGMDTGLEWKFYWCVIFVYLRNLYLILRYNMVSPAHIRTDRIVSGRIRMRSDRTGIPYRIIRQFAKRIDAVKWSSDVRKEPSGRQGQFLCPGVGLLWVYRVVKVAEFQKQINQSRLSLTLARYHPSTGPLYSQYYSQYPRDKP